MFGLSPRTGARLLAPSLLVLLTAVGTTGCALPVPGFAVPAPVVSGPAGAPAPLIAPAPAGGGTALDDRWERVTDRESGDSVLLPGPVEDTAYEGDGRGFSSRTPPDGLTLVAVHVEPVAGAVDLTELEAGVGTSIGGKLTASQENDVQGNPGLAARYALEHAGRPSVALVQYVARPDHVLALLVVAPTARTAVAEDTIRTMIAGLQFSGAAGSTPSTPSGGSTSAAGIYREWLQAGWRATPWLLARDADSGVSALLLGAEPEPPTAGTTTVAWRSTGAPAAVESHLRITPVTGSPLLSADLQQQAQEVATGVGGSLVSSTPTTVHGHPALDARIDATAGSGEPVRILVRAVAGDRHLVTLHTVGSASAERTIGQVQQLSVANLVVP
jgi:hypothetical protein